ncbi:MAG: hypothetical protein P1U56_18505 [Saprospiraceae bacterium]|nr:hypothetical protein [Saprospiraceae bacterium]
MSKYKEFLVAMIPFVLCFAYILYNYPRQSTTNDLQIEIDKALASQDLHRNLDTTLYADYIINRLQNTTEFDVIQNDQNLTITANRDIWLDQLDLGVLAFNNYYDIEGSDIKAEVDGDMVSVTLKVNEQGVIEYFPLVFFKKNR